MNLTWIKEKDSDIEKAWIIKGFICIRIIPFKFGSKEKYGLRCNCIDGKKSYDTRELAKLNAPGFVSYMLDITKKEMDKNG